MTSRAARRDDYVSEAVKGRRRCSDPCHLQTLMMIVVVIVVVTVVVAIVIVIVLMLGPVFIPPFAIVTAILPAVVPIQTAARPFFPVATVGMVATPFAMAIFPIVVGPPVAGVARRADRSQQT